MPFPFSTDKHPWLYEKYLFDGVRHTIEHYEASTGHPSFEGYALNIEQIFSWYVEDQLGYVFTTQETEDMPMENGRACFGFTNYTNKVITIDHQRSTETQRHTMAHELFHVLHHRKFFKTLGSKLNNKRYEDQAHAYARSLLMPSASFKERFLYWKGQRALFDSEQNELQFITRAVAGDFNISVKTAARRMLELQLYCQNTLSDYLNSNAFVFPFSAEHRDYMAVSVFYSQMFG